MSPERFEKIKDVLNKRQPDVTVILDNVHKPHNIAAILRSCDATGIGTIHARSKNSKIGLNLKAASGSNHWVKVYFHNQLSELYKTLLEKNVNIFVANNSEGAIDYREVNYTSETAIVLGAELDGVSNDSLSFADREIKVPIVGMVESLNVSVTNAVILYEIQRQRKEAGLYKSRRLSINEYEKLLFEFSYPEVARILQKKGSPYPKLDKFGQIIS
jgi:tRNA (guanosine-2'-O-)-methyltransferase